MKGEIVCKGEDERVVTRGEVHGSQDITSCSNLSSNAAYKLIFSKVVNVLPSDMIH